MDLYQLVLVNLSIYRNELLKALNGIVCKLFLNSYHQAMANSEVYQSSSIITYLSSCFRRFFALFYGNLYYFEMNNLLLLHRSTIVPLLTKKAQTRK